MTTENSPLKKDAPLAKKADIKAAVAVLVLLLLSFLVLSNFALLRQNRKLTLALQDKLPDEFVEKALDKIPGIETNLHEAIQQWTVNEQHLNLLDDIQSQQLKLIRGLTNRVNESAQLIRNLEEQQDLLDEATQNAQLAATQRARALLPAPVRPATGEGELEVEVIADAGLPEAPGEEDNSLETEQTDIDIVLEEAFEGVQVEALVSLDNPAFSGVVVWDYDNQTGLIQLSNLPVLPGGFIYQLWVLDPNYEAFIDAGAFLLPQSSIPFEYTFRPGLEIIQAAGFAVTAEPAPGTSIPDGPTVVATPNLLN